MGACGSQTQWLSEALHLPLSTTCRHWKAVGPIGGRRSCVKLRAATVLLTSWISSSFFPKKNMFFVFFVEASVVLLLIICTRCGMLQADWPEDGPTVPKLSALLNHWHILTSWRHQLTTCIWTYIDILTTYHSWHNNMTTYDNNHRHLMKSLHPFFFVFLSCESSSAAQVTLLKFMQQRNFQAPSDWPGYRSLAIRKAWNAIELMRHDVKR